MSKPQDDVVPAIDPDALMFDRQVRAFFGGRGTSTMHRWRRDPKIGFPAPDCVIAGPELLDETNHHRASRPPNTQACRPGTTQPVPARSRNEAAAPDQIAAWPNPQHGRYPCRRLRPRVATTEVRTLSVDQLDELAGRLTEYADAIAACSGVRVGTAAQLRDDLRTVVKLIRALMATGEGAIGGPARRARSGIRCRRAQV
jgi:hypothetical protein